VKHRIRADTFGYLQRCFPGVVSDVDASEARRAGTAAVAAAMAGTTSGSVAFKRVGDGAAYAVETFITPLHTVAKETKPMPREWINAAGNDVVMEKLMPYLKPLVGTLPAIGRLAMTGAKKA
jgi:6-phosphofructokinase 1